MANYMVVRRLMEQRGRGWPVIQRVMSEFNATRAELEEDRGGKFVRATLWLVEQGD
jgi:anti-sigma regulatory factor (Ser/Thr protein kinase)